MCNSSQWAAFLLSLSAAWCVLYETAKRPGIVAEHSIMQVVPLPAILVQPHHSRSCGLPCLPGAGISHAVWPVGLLACITHGSGTPLPAPGPAQAPGPAATPTLPPKVQCQCVESARGRGCGLPQFPSLPCLPPPPCANAIPRSLAAHWACRACCLCDPLACWVLMITVPSPPPPARLLHCKDKAGPSSAARQQSGRATARDRETRTPRPATRPHTPARRCRPAARHKG